MGKYSLCVRGGGTEHLLSLRELRLSTGLAPRAFAAALGAEAGEPMPTSVYLAYEGEEEPPPSIVRAAGRGARRMRRGPGSQIMAGGTVEVSPAPRITPAAGIAGLDGLPDRSLGPDEPANHAYVAKIRDAIRQIVNIEMKLGSDELAPVAFLYLRAARVVWTGARTSSRSSASSRRRSPNSQRSRPGCCMMLAARTRPGQAGYEALHLARLASFPQQLDLFLANLAHVEIFTERPGAALHIARHAPESAGLTSRMTAMFKIREAPALAQLGDKSGTKRALESARSHLLDGVSAQGPPTQTTAGPCAGSFTSGPATGCPRSDRDRPRATAAAVGADTSRPSNVAEMPVGRWSSNMSVGAISDSRITLDRFGNLITNLKPPLTALHVNGHDVRVLARTFGDMPTDQPFVYVGSMGFVAIGVAKGPGGRGPRSARRNAGEGALVGA